MRSRTRQPHGGNVLRQTIPRGARTQGCAIANGFLFVPRYDFGAVPSLDRVLVPAGENDVARQETMAAWLAARPTLAAEDIYQNVGSGETAYDATLRDLARTHSASLARGVADGLFSTTDARFPDAGSPVGGLLTALALSLFGAAAVFGATHLRISRRTRLQAVPRSA